MIGDRALGRDPDSVARRGRAVCDGLLASGVLPVVKHLPGHGRAQVDSHEALPVVEASMDALRAVDFAAFAPLADAALGMTGHLIFTAIDAERPATLSPTAIQMIREEIGFDGLLMTDDLSMKALTGPFAKRTTDSLAAGCDVVLHCNGNPAEMAEIAGVRARIDRRVSHPCRTRRGRQRHCARRDRRRPPRPIDRTRGDAPCLTSLPFLIPIPKPC